MQIEDLDEMGLDNTSRFGKIIQPNFDLELKDPDDPEQDEDIVPRGYHVDKGYSNRSFPMPSRIARREEKKNKRSETNKFFKKKNIIT